jgi:catechol 2,3-dioxygenase-like lactoylglutathione lyase family enzyme
VLGSSDLVAFVGTANPVHAKHFYGEVLGLPLESESPFALVFTTPGAALRVTVVERVAPAPYTVLGWGVEDIASAIAELSDQGVKFARFDGVEQDELGIWKSPSGAKVAWFKDPDGNLLSITQDLTAD